MSEYPSTVGDRYDLLGVVGSGGMGLVWRAYDRILHRQVACKVLSGSIAHDPYFQMRFQREARHIASLSHPNIVMVFDSGTEGDLPYIVMEYVHGPSLRQVLRSQGALPIPVTAALAVDVLAALGHAHERGIVHRDVKPANLLLESGGTVKVADFGIAKTLGENTGLTAEGVFVGTSTYASPEQLSGHELGTTSDLYSLGCVLFECLTGRPPYIVDNTEKRLLQHRFADLPSLADMRSDTPDEIVRGIARAMAKDPSDRFAGAIQMGEVFAPFAAEGQLQMLLSPPVVEGGRDETERIQSAGTPVRSVGGSSTRSVASEGSKWSRQRAYVIAASLVLLIAAAILGVTAFGGGNGHGLQRRSTLASGGYLRPDQFITSRNGRFTLVMQSDGNLVEYTRRHESVRWESGTSGNFDAYVVMQSDGNLVVYPHGKSAPAPGQPTDALWDSGTFGHPGSSAALLSSGALEVRSPGTGAVWWEASDHRAT
jgi:hypothetical protein